MSVSEKKIAILGCGAIGGLILGHLSKQGHDVRGVVRDYQKEPLLSEGLSMEGVRGVHKIKVKADTQLNEKVDLAVFATKINDLKNAIEENRQFLQDATVLSTQNGIRADYVLSEYFSKEKIINGIVMFGATFYAPNKIVHNFEGDFILGNIFGANPDNLDETVEILSSCFNAVSLENLKGAKYLKLFINLNNCIPAVLGISMQEAFSDIDLARLAMLLNKEAYEIVSKSRISLESLPAYPKERIHGLISMPLDEAAALFSKIMTSLSKEPLYGSILQSIKRGKISEIDYINGEIATLALASNMPAPLNKKITELVHRVEESRNFLSKEELLSEIKEQANAPGKRS